MELTEQQKKLIEALVYIVNSYGEEGRFFILKTLYFAEYNHLRKYGRPLVGDRMIAMENGPVPSQAYDLLKKVKPNSEDNSFINDALEVSNSGKHPVYKALRQANLDYFSKSDLICLDQAYEHCVNRTFGSISDETHKHKAWDKADLNGEMSINDMLDGVDEEIKDDVRTFLSYGVL